jgi:hypothetical protein
MISTQTIQRIHPNMSSILSGNIPMGTGQVNPIYSISVTAPDSKHCFVFENMSERHSPFCGKSFAVDRTTQPMNPMLFTNTSKTESTQIRLSRKRKAEDTAADEVFEFPQS